MKTRPAYIDTAAYVRRNRQQPAGERGWTFDIKRHGKVIDFIAFDQPTPYAEAAAAALAHASWIDGDLVVLCAKAW